MNFDIPTKYKIESMLKKMIIIPLLVFLLGCTEEEGPTFLGPSFEIGFNESGAVSILADPEGKVDYRYADKENALLAIQVANELEYPTTMEYDSKAELYVLHYLKNDIAAKVKIENKEDYLTFELVELSQNEKVQLVLWGPFKTTINETIGETIGVVRNKLFSLGIQALNPRTLGGYPTSDDSTPSFNIFGTTSLVDVSDSLEILYRGHTALPKNYGSSLQAYTRNRNEERIISTLKHEKYSAPAYKDEGVIGSKIALFGCRPDEVLNVIEKIELNEGLPHPMLNGVWAKRATEASSAYLIQDFNVENIGKAIDLTKRAGLKYLYQGGPFENWGHFDLKSEQFPNNWESMKQCVDMAEEQGIKVGLHTLSNFITTNDLYVTPIPDERLAKVGSSRVVKDITSDDTIIEIEDPTYFNQMENNNLHAVVVGNEIIRYERVSENAPWLLLNCERGAFNTKRASHIKGSDIAKLIDHGYKTFLSNSELTIEMSTKLASLYNQTGLKQISFDGLEGNLSTGMGSYGELLFTKTWFDNLSPEIKNDYVMDASRPGHFFWHMFTRMNWGEPWYAGFRESQTSYRLLNQDYFRRNFIPCMLGWFSMRENTSIEDIEWMLARSAAFDAGYALVTSNDLVEQNGFGNEILEKIKQWEKARMSNSFSEQQKKRMEDITAEFTLDAEADGSWKLTPFDVQRFEHKMIIRQPGEPVWSTFEYANIHNEQPLQFIITTSNNGTASKLFLEIDDFKKIDLNIKIGPNQNLKYSGGNEVVLYDSSWNRLMSIPIDPAKLKVGKGNHKLKVDCSFDAGENVSLKLELKTKGPAEVVALKNE